MKKATSKVVAIVHEVEPSLLDIIVQENGVSKVPEVTVQVERQLSSCCSWMTTSRENETTVNGHIKIKPPAEGERIIINYVNN
jgi:hypothetical protein